jgi:hypothetical protein
LNELIEHIRALLAHENRAEVVATLQKEAQPIYQAVFDKGHGAGLKAKGKDVDELQEKITALEKERDDFKGKLTESEANKPDVAKIRQQYEDQIKQLKEEHGAKVKELKDGHAAEKKTTARERLVNKLITAGVDPDYAETLAGKPEYNDRITFRKDDGKLEVLQAGSSTPLVPADGKDALDLLAGEIRAKVPAKFVTSQSDDGSGDRGGPGGSGQTNWTDYRKRIETERETSGKTARPAEDTAVSRLTGAV